MRGLTQGEVSSKTVPRLLFFCRQGEVLLDIYDGSFIVQDITNPSVGTPVVIGTTVLLTEGSHKLGTGRYVIPFDTTSRSVGSHRVIVSYRLSSTGPTYVQVIPFEVLSAIDYPTGRSFCAYASTRRLIEDGYVASTTPIRTLQRLVEQYSRRIESWTGRFFEPRYGELRTEPLSDGPILSLQEAVIAIEKVQSTDKTLNSGVPTDDVAYDYDQDAYRVYNRHMDGLLSPDDRQDPKLVLLTGGSWAGSWQGLRLTGVFGYTDPAPAEMSDRVGIGETPTEIAQVLGALITRHLEDPSLSDPEVQRPGSVLSMRTRDQSITFGGYGKGGGGSGSYSEPTGDPILDQKLIRFASPLMMRPAGRRQTQLEWVDDSTSEDFNS